MDLSLKNILTAELNSKSQLLFMTKTKMKCELRRFLILTPINLHFFLRIPIYLKPLLHSKTYLFGCGAKWERDQYNSSKLACAFYPSIVDNSWPYEKCNGNCQSSTCAKKSSSYRELCGTIILFH